MNGKQDKANQHCLYSSSQSYQASFWTRKVGHNAKQQLFEGKKATSIISWVQTPSFFHISTLKQTGQVMGLSRGKRGGTISSRPAP